MSNAETIQVKFDWKGIHDIHNEMNTNVRIHCLLKTPTGGAVAAAALPEPIVPHGMALGPVASSSNNNQDGGRRRRKTHRKRRHARKKTRAHK